MSNATAMRAINDQLAASYFDVTEEKLVTESGLQVPGKKVICRADNGSPLAVVGDRYKTVTNEEVFGSFIQVLAKTNLDLSGAEVVTEFSHKGARVFAQLILPNHRISVGEKDETALRIIARNSYDGSTAFTVQAGGYRFVCSNGQITGDSLSYFHGKHVQSLDTRRAADHVSSVLNSFENSKEWFESLRSKKVTDAGAYACLAFASRNAEAARVGYPKSREEMPPVMRTLFDSWGVHKRTIGSNAWALYNTMTHFATHWGSDKAEVHENAAAAKFRREDRIRETLQSPVWLKLAA